MAWRIVISSAGFVLLSLRLLGEPAGAIAGRVADESGGPLPGVTVEARGQANAQIGYGLGPGVRLALDVFNVLNARVSDIDYFYASRLPGEPAGGVEDIHTHPAEPRTARLSVVYSL